MNRTLIALASIAASALTIGATVSPALANGQGYRLVPAVALKAADKIAVRDVLWNCEGASCVASKATSRPEIVCATAARKIGKLSAFAANGEAFTAEQLDKCNAKAK